MIIIALSIFVAAGIWIIRRYWPVKGLTYVDAALLRQAPELTADAVLVDVRDAVYYEQCHINGAINISLGRLPFVWQKELLPDHPVYILTDRSYQSKKAARFLKNRGFREIYAVRGNFCA